MVGSVQHSRNIFKMYQKISINIKLRLGGQQKGFGHFLYLLYFIAILHWSIGHRSSASIDGGSWMELVVCQMIFFRILPKQCASRWLWGVHVISFLAGSILMYCGKFRFDFFVVSYPTIFSISISTSIFDCPVLSHSSLLDIIWGHQIPILT